ncbi:hypothetical protein TgHK011_004966 [Trichoderma gracile]|nr:hypothetical protein TgHK011_004966 [Trichoderma gracile]
MDAGGWRWLGLYSGSAPVRLDLLEGGSASRGRFQALLVLGMVRGGRLGNGLSAKGDEWLQGSSGRRVFVLRYSYVRCLQKWPVLRRDASVLVLGRGPAKDLSGLAAFGSVTAFPASKNLQNSSCDAGTFGKEIGRFRSQREEPF